MARLRLALTGASGFLGRHVLAALAGRDVAVTALTRDPARLAGRPGLAVVEGDLARPTPALLDRLAEVDVLLHLAWDGLPAYRAARHLEEELPAQAAFLDALLDRGLPALVGTGTCLEYGRRDGPLTVDLEPAPDTAYGLAKDRLRRRLAARRASRPFAFTWARLFYTWGDGQAPTSLWPQLARAAAAGEASFAMSGGEQIRDYLPAAEIGRILAALACARADAGLLDLCSGRPRRLRDLVEAWCRKNGWAIALDLGRYPYPDWEAMAFWGDAAPLTRLLADLGETPPDPGAGWKPAPAD